MSLTTAATGAPRVRPGDAELAGALRTGVMRLSRRIRNERDLDGPSVGQLAVLGSLDRFGARTVGELAAIERVKPPSMTRTVNGLSAAGLVARRAHATDGRQVVVELTDAGRALLAEERRRRDAWLAHRLLELEADERDLLRRVAPLLERLAAS